jgi:long-chain fatty acid transport protein
MKNGILPGALILSLAASTALFATNGDTLIGVGAKTRAMGGAGIAFSHGAESTLVNPALITHVEETEISFGGTIFMPDIHTEIDYGMGGIHWGSFGADSDADLSVIPAVALASRVSENVFVGVGMWGTAGMGTDFRGTPQLFEMETTLQMMQFAVPVAYRYENLSVGIAPILQYGSLDIHYNNGTAIGDGQNQDFGFGVSLGAVYHFESGFNLGAMYKSEIEMSYGRSLSTATAPFAPLPGFPEIGDTLTQPAEYGIGLGYHHGPHGIALDWKRIAWGSAEGYKQFGWKDQDVFSIGYQYEADTWSLRVGYNHASNPLTLYNAGPTEPGKAALDMFNLLGFPATAQDHLTAGGTYLFSQNFSADFTVVYAFNEKNGAEISSLQMGGAGFPLEEIRNEHSELGITLQLNYKF